MDDLSCSRYVTLCEVYAGMAKSFYQQYKDADFRFSQIESFPPELKGASMCDYGVFYGLKQSCSLSALVFQAMAVEALVNLFGAFLLGDNKYYSEYENKEDKKKRFPTLEKLKLLFINELSAPYPTNAKHYSVIKNLFNKRDKLVHTKPHAIDVTSKQEDSQDFIDRLCEEAGFIYQGLEDEMNSYEILKANLIQARPSFNDCFFHPFKDTVSVFYNGLLEKPEEQRGK